MNIDKMIKMGEAGDLDGLEAERQRMFNELLSTVDDPKKRRAMQQAHFRVSNLRYRYRNPIVCMVKSSKIMIDSLCDLNVELDNLKGAL